MAASVASQDMGLYLGCEVSVSLTNNDRFTGELVFYDAESASFGVKSLLPGTTKNSSIHWIRTSSLQNVQVTKLPPTVPQSVTRGLAYVDTTLLTNFAEEKSKTSGPKYIHPVGTTKEAQDLFELLAKTMPCSWTGTSLLCYGVTIRSPYQVSDCSGGSEAELERIKRIVGEFHKTRRIAA